MKGKRMSRLWNDEYPGIYVDNDVAFYQKCAADLDKIVLRPLGKELLTLISMRCTGVGTGPGKYVLIEPGVGTFAERIMATGAVPQGDGDMRMGRTMRGTSIQLPGHGASSVVKYTPEDTAVRIYTMITGAPCPSFIVLAHELTHAWHQLSGGYRPGEGKTLQEKWAAGNLQEEAYTIGIGPYANTRLSENTIREEWDLKPLRTYWTKPGDCDNLPRLSDTKF
jgi:Effector protein